MDFEGVMIVPAGQVQEERTFSKNVFLFMAQAGFSRRDRLSKAQLFDLL
jgi:hypothetical protein